MFDIVESFKGILEANKIKAVPLISYTKSKRNDDNNRYIKLLNDNYDKIEEKIKDPQTDALIERIAHFFINTRILEYKKNKSNCVAGDGSPQKEPTGLWIERKKDVNLKWNSIALQYTTSFETMMTALKKNNPGLMEIIDFEKKIGIKVYRNYFKEMIEPVNFDKLLKLFLQDPRAKIKHKDFNYIDQKERENKNRRIDLEADIFLCYELIGEYFNSQLSVLHSTETELRERNREFITAKLDTHSLIKFYWPPGIFYELNKSWIVTNIGNKLFQEEQKIYQYLLKKIGDAVGDADKNIWAQIKQVFDSEKIYKTNPESGYSAISKEEIKEHIDDIALHSWQQNCENDINMIIRSSNLDSTPLTDIAKVRSKIVTDLHSKLTFERYTQVIDVIWNDLNNKLIKFTDTNKSPITGVNDFKIVNDIATKLLEIEKNEQEKVPQALQEFNTKTDAASQEFDTYFKKIQDELTAFQTKVRVEIKDKMVVIAKNNIFNDFDTEFNEASKLLIGRGYDLKSEILDLIAQQKSKIEFDKSKSANERVSKIAALTKEVEDNAKTCIETLKTLYDSSWIGTLEKCRLRATNLYISTIIKYIETEAPIEADRAMKKMLSNYSDKILSNNESEIRKEITDNTLIDTDIQDFINQLVNAINDFKNYRDDKNFYITEMNSIIQDLKTNFDKMYISKGLSGFLKTRIQKIFANYETKVKELYDTGIFGGEKDNFKIKIKSAAKKNDTTVKNSLSKLDQYIIQTQSSYKSITDPILQTLEANYSSVITTIKNSGLLIETQKKIALEALKDKRDLTNLEVQMGETVDNFKKDMIKSINALQEIEPIKTKLDASVQALLNQFKTEWSNSKLFTVDFYNNLIIQEQQKQVGDVTKKLQEIHAKKLNENLASLKTISDAIVSNSAEAKKLVFRQDPMYMSKLLEAINDNVKTMEDLFEELKKEAGKILNSSITTIPNKSIDSFLTNFDQTLEFQMKSDVAKIQKKWTELDLSDPAKYIKRLNGGVPDSQAKLGMSNKLSSSDILKTMDTLKEKQGFTKDNIDIYLDNLEAVINSTVTSHDVLTINRWLKEIQNAKILNLVQTNRFAKIVTQTQNLSHLLLFNK